MTSGFVGGAGQSFSRILKMELLQRELVAISNGASVTFLNLNDDDDELFVNRKLARIFPEVKNRNFTI